MSYNTSRRSRSRSRMKSPYTVRCRASVFLSKREQTSHCKIQRKIGIGARAQTRYYATNSTLTFTLLYLPFRHLNWHTSKLNGVFFLLRLIFALIFLFIFSLFKQIGSLNFEFGFLKGRSFARNILFYVFVVKVEVKVARILNFGHGISFRFSSSEKFSLRECT